MANLRNISEVEEISTLTGNEKVLLNVNGEAKQVRSDLIKPDVETFPVVEEINDGDKVLLNVNGVQKQADASLIGPNIHSDWNQNDSTAPDYIKNRICYTKDPVESVFATEQTVTLSGDDMPTPIVTTSTEIKPLTKYRVTINDDVYDEVSYYIQEARSNVIGKGIPPTFDPFVIVAAQGQAFIFTSKYSGDIVLSVTEIYEENVKLPEKYLPEKILKPVGKITPENGEIFNNYSENVASSGFSHAEGWQTTASGDGSHAEGNNTTASGDYGSHAEGDNTTASGHGSHAEGSYTTASGHYSHAEGKYTTASGNCSHTEGGSTQATARNSHAEGGNTIANAVESHAEGAKTTASGKQSHAEGSTTAAMGDNSHSEGNKTTATGKNSHSEGYFTVAEGQASHAEGVKTKTVGQGSHAEGGFRGPDGTVELPDITIKGADTGLLQDLIISGTTSFGVNSHAEGTQTVSIGYSSHADGNGTVANSDCGSVSGKFNIIDKEKKYAQITGNGTSNMTRSNAHTLDWKGNAWYQGAILLGETTTIEELRDFEKSGVVIMPTGIAFKTAPGMFGISENAVIIKSSTPGSGKYFQISVDDTGTVKATDVTSMVVPQVPAPATANDEASNSNAAQDGSASEVMP